MRLTTRAEFCWLLFTETRYEHKKPLAQCIKDTIGRNNEQQNQLLVRHNDHLPMTIVTHQITFRSVGSLARMSSFRPSKQIEGRDSVTSWLDYFLIFNHIGTYNKENLPNRIKICPILDRQTLKKLPQTFKFSQKFKILSNLVPLVQSITLCSLCFWATLTGASKLSTWSTQNQYCILYQEMVPIAKEYIGSAGT